EENIASGRTLFNQHCASCHGEDGRAQTQMATSMKVKPANLTGSAVHGRMPGEIYSVITNGIKTSGMPAFKDKMSEQERWQTVLYARRRQGEHQDTAENQQAGTAAKRDEVQHPHQGHAATEQPQAIGHRQMRDETHADMAGGDHAGHSMMSNMMTTVTGGPF